MASTVEYEARQLAEVCRDAIYGGKEIYNAICKLIDALNEADLTEDRVEYIQAARRLYNHEGSVEIDDDAIVSLSEDGAYIQAWVYVEREYL